MKEPSVLISILNWNAPENTIQTVRSVLLSAYDNYKIVLLDNHSTDNSESLLREAFPQIQLLKMRSNLGYAGAHKEASGIAVKENYELLWILNNDVEVYPDSLKELVNAYKRNGASLLGSVSLDPDGTTISFAGGLEVDEYNKTHGKSGYNIFAGKKIDEVELQERPVSGVEGSSFLIPVSVIKKNGFMDTRFFLYGEETDYCYRLREKFNVPTIVVPSSKVIHHGGGSFRKNEKLKWVRIYYTTRNGNLVHKKYQKENKIIEMSAKRIPYYFRYFFKHYFIIPASKKDTDYWFTYYQELGNLHSMLRIKGKYLNPEKFQNF